MSRRRGDLRARLYNIKARVSSSAGIPASPAEKFFEGYPGCARIQRPNFCSSGGISQYVEDLSRASASSGMLMA